MAAAYLAICHRERVADQVLGTIVTRRTFSGYPSSARSRNRVTTVGHCSRWAFADEALFAKGVVSTEPTCRLRHENACPVRTGPERTTIARLGAGAIEPHLADAAIVAVITRSARGLANLAENVETEAFQTIGTLVTIDARLIERKTTRSIRTAFLSCLAVDLRRTGRTKLDPACVVGAVADEIANAVGSVLATTTDRFTTESRLANRCLTGAVFDRVARSTGRNGFPADSLVA